MSQYADFVEGSNVPGYDPSDPTAGYKSPGSSSALSAEDAATVSKAMEEDDSGGYEPEGIPSPVINTSQGKFQFALIQAILTPFERQQVGYIIPVSPATFASWLPQPGDLDRPYRRCRRARLQPTPFRAPRPSGGERPRSPWCVLAADDRGGSG